MNSHRFLRVILFALVLSSVAALFFMANNARSARAAIPLRRTNSGSVVAAPQANELHVCQSGGANFTTIQAAVDNAQPGDLIKVAAATYTEAKVVSGTQYNLYIATTVSIRGGYTCADFTSQNPSANVTTVRPFTTTQSVVSILGINGQTSQVAPTLDGFTITGGGGGNHGGGISMHDSDATISNNIITGNTSFLLGGGIFVQRGAPHIQYNRIQNNTANAGGGTALGGGIELETATGSVLSNIIANNALTGATTNGGGVDITSGGGPVLLANNTIVGNTANGVHADSNLTLVNNIIMTHPVGVTATATVSTSYNIYFGNTTNAQGFSLGATDLTVNPQLTADYHLSPGSPAIDAGTHTNAPNRDIDREPRAMTGTSGLYKIDIGADEFTGAAQTNHELATQPADFTLIGPGNPVENPGSTGPNDWIGFAAWGGDISGDNRADLIVGAPNLSDMFDGGPDDSGRVFALYNNGTRRLGVIDFYTTTPNLEVRSGLNQQHIAQSFATADLNGDAARDLIIGASGAANFNVKGSVFVFQGGAGLFGTKTLSPTNQATWRFRSGENTSTFGGQNSLAAGKLNNDAIDDLVVGEGNATGPGNRAFSGAVFVFFGSASLPALWDLATMPASLTIYGPATNSGLSRVAVGDVNGDGKLDLIARSSTNAYVFYGPLSSGTIDLASTPADATITGLDNDWLATGDVDGDGKADIILGRTNEIDLVRGGTLGASQTIGAAAAARFTGITPQTLSAFDWNGDGKAEVVIGNPSNNRAFVVFGGALSGTADVFDRAAWIITGEMTGDQFGFSLGSGDLDADGTTDLIIGSRTHNVTNHPLHFDDAGAVYVFYGVPQPRIPTVLANISTRLRVETGDNVLIGGFIVTGTQPKRMIARAIGPSLPLTGVLADPTLELRDSAGGLIRSNDNWRSDQEAEIIATGIPPSDDMESAIVAILPANNSAYTAIVRGVNDTTGIGLVEAYDLDRTVDSKLANISTRGLVQTGDNVLIAGTIVLGGVSQRVIVRAIGPSLSVPGKLADPILELRDGNGGLIRSNDNWRSDQEAEIIATGIPPTNDLESAIVATLPANGASYTAIVRGVNGTTGVALVEVYGLN